MMTCKDVWIEHRSCGDGMCFLSWLCLWLSMYLLMSMNTLTNASGDINLIWRLQLLVWCCKMENFYGMFCSSYYVNLVLQAKYSTVCMSNGVVYTKT